MSIQLTTDRAGDLTTKRWLFFHAEFPGNLKPRLTGTTSIRFTSPPLIWRASANRKLRRSRSIDAERNRSYKLSRLLAHYASNPIKLCNVSVTSVVPSSMFMTTRMITRY